MTAAAEGRTFPLGYDPDDPPLALVIQRGIDARARARQIRPDVAHYEALLADALASKIDLSTVRKEADRD